MDTQQHLFPPLIKYPLLLFVAFLCLYAWKNRFVSLCGAVLLVAVIEHPNFPKTIGNIQGLNPWNMLVFSIMMAWAARHGDEAHEWDLPPIVGRMLVAFLAVIVVGVVRLLLASRPVGYTSGMIISEYLVNTIKWVIPSLLLFDACRTRQRVIIVLGVIISLYVLLAMQVIHWMPLSYISGSGESFAHKASRIIEKNIGYNRVTFSMMLAGASWATLAVMPIFRKNLHKLVLLGAACTIALGQAMTGGRTGYVTWMAVGVLLASLRWRKLLLVIPVTVFAIGLALPSVQERMLQGFGGREGNFTVGSNSYEMTSGRDIAWPVVIEEICKAPLLGYGREAMVTTGIGDHLLNVYDESFPHPHQAYLQLLLDNGIVGFSIVMSLHIYLVWLSLSHVMVKTDPLICAIGCTAFCLLLALMVGAFGGQTFYPREGAIGMWAAIGLLLRVHVNSILAAETDAPVFPDELPDKWFVNIKSNDI